MSWEVCGYLNYLPAICCAILLDNSFRNSSLLQLRCVRRPGTSTYVICVRVL